jgi:hypothetical protein
MSQIVAISHFTLSYNTILILSTTSIGPTKYSKPYKVVNLTVHSWVYICHPLYHGAPTTISNMACMEHLVLEVHCAGIKEDDLDVELWLLENKYILCMQIIMPLRFYFWPMGKSTLKIHTWFATLLICGSGLYLRFGLWDQKTGIDPRV